MMRRAMCFTGSFCLTLAMAPALAVGFQAPRDQKADTAPAKPPAELTITECLTAAADGRGFALTTTDPDPLATAASRVTTDVKQTFTYELMGDLAEARRYAGQRVTVRGRLDPSRKTDVEVDKRQKTAPPNTPPGRAEVKVKEEAEIEVRWLQVTSVSTSGQRCTA